MDEKRTYEIDLLALWGKCLLHWKAIAVVAILAGLVFFGVKTVTYTPSDDSGAVTALVIGLVLGCVFMVCWYCLPPIFKGVLLAESSVAELTGWQRIGRVKGLKKTADPLVKWGRSLLYKDHKADDAKLRHEAREITALLLKDAGITSGTLGLVGRVSEETLKLVAEVFHLDGMSVVTANLEDRVDVHKLCREADAIILVGQTSSVRTKDIDDLLEVVKPLKKFPVGYVLA